MPTGNRQSRRRHWAASQAAFRVPHRLPDPASDNSWAGARRRALRNGPPRPAYRRWCGRSGNTVFSARAGNWRRAAGQCASRVTRVQRLRSCLLLGEELVVVT